MRNDYVNKSSAGSEDMVFRRRQFSNSKVKFKLLSFNSFCVPGGILLFLLFKFFKVLNAFKDLFNFVTVPNFTEK